MRASTMEVSICLRSWFKSGLVKPEIPAPRSKNAAVDDEPLTVVQMDVYDSSKDDDETIILEPLSSVDE